MLRDAKFFTHPQTDWQRRYEALLASFVEHLPAKVVADRFRYTPGYVHLLRHQFRTGKADFGEPAPEGMTARRRISADTRQKIRAWREQRLSVGDIAELLSQAGVEVSVATVAKRARRGGFLAASATDRLEGRCHGRGRAGAGEVGGDLTGRYRRSAL